MNSSAQSPGMPKKTFLEADPVPVPDRGKPAKSLEFDEFLKIIDSKWGAGIVVDSSKDHAGDPYVVVKGEKIVEVLEHLATEPKTLLNSLCTVSCVDYLPKNLTDEKGEPIEEIYPHAPCFEVVYVMFSHLHKHQLIVKVRLDRENPKLPSVTPLFRVANFQERECYDIMGIVFEGHPDLRRILLPDDWVGHPLRKDYVFPEEYNGMKVPL